MKRLLAALAPFVLACVHRDAPPTTEKVNAPTTAQTPLTPSDDETALDDAWFEAAPAEADVVTRVEATRFIDATFTIVERHLYDPAVDAPS